jgi:transcriptional regulator with XRE-family HTH domain
MVKMKDTKMLGERIRAVRKDNRLTQEQFARKLNTSKSSIINYESGKRIPDALFLVSILEHFKVDARWLMLGNGQPDASRPRNEEKTGLPGTDNDSTYDEKVSRMIEHLRIPAVKLLLMAEYERIKMIFQSFVDEYEKSKADRDWEEQKYCNSGSE